MTLELHLRLAGALLITLAAAHPLFAIRLGWRRELAAVSTLTRQIFYVHSFFIVLMLVMMGLLTLAFTATLTTPSPLGGLVAAGCTAVWAIRLVVQWCVYDRRLWRGDRFNTAVHTVFTGLWIYLTAVFGWAALRQFGG